MHLCLVATMYNGILGYIPLFSHPFFFVYGAIEIDFALSLKVDNKDFVCVPACFDIFYKPCIQVYI